MVRAVMVRAVMARVRAAKWAGIRSDIGGSTVDATLKHRGQSLIMAARADCDMALTTAP
jgi:hypothetical protein